MGKKAHRNKDKYYVLAKEQGYRARSAFKLIQLNKKYNFLSSANVLIDLCAAPGGCLIIGVDLAPIKPIKNVITHVSDITTLHCRSLLKGDMRDRESELVLHSLRLATEFLKPGGLFITKVFRSTDYHSLMWVFQQLFKKVEATKPHSSRDASAEIFVVCQGYLAPAKLDPRFLDPKHVFKELDVTSAPRVDVFNQKDKQKRFRDGYDESLGQILHRRTSLTTFIEAEDPVAVLGEYNQLVFDDAAQEWATHPSTTFEIKACCDDLKVLGRSDFKSMLKWRMGLRRERSKRLRDEAKAAESSDDEEDTGPVDPDADVDEALSKALRALQQKKRREKKKAKRKEMKQLERQAMGMNHQAVSLEEHESLFTLANIKTMKQLKEIGDVNLDDAGSDEFGQYLDSSASEDEAPRKKRINTASGAGGDSSDEEDYMKAIEAEMDHHYEEYKRRQAEKTHVMKTSLDGLSRKKLLLKKAQLKEMDFEGKLNKTHESYLKLLSGARVKAPTMEEEDEAAAEAAAQDSDDSDSEGNQSDGSNASEIAAIRQSQSKLARKRKTEGALIADLDDKIDPTVRSNRWFSQPMFEDMELEELQEDSRAKRAWSRDQRSAGQVALESSDEEEEEEETDAAAGGGSGGVYVLAPEILAKAKKAASASAKETAAQKAQRKKALAAAARISGINAEVESSDEDGEIAKMMKGLEPSEREKRKQKLRKVREREEAKSKKEKKMEIVAMEPSDSEVDEESGSDADENLPERKRQKQKEALIRAGMGAAVGGSDQDDDGEGFEVVAKPADIEAGQEADSDSEMDDSEGSDDDVSSVDPRDLDYDSETHAEILALGKKLKQHTEAKKLVDASYNRYCNNDEEMPHWFVADENRHWRPQLPITREEVNAMRDRVRDIAERPIKKVMEARMRKKKRAAMKLAKARKKAAAIADDDEIAAKSKEKAIARVYRQAKQTKNSTVVVVSRNGHQIASTGGGGKGSKVKHVDPRMRTDTRGAKRAEKRAGKHKRSTRQSSSKKRR